ncbi:MAG TPA: ACT domain-containing protein, partial [Chloroflexota bacterium]|nr:ACT domain-containing protein [Chloroflexota bacterium]
MAQGARELAIIARNIERPGVLHQLTRVIMEHGANICYVDMVERDESAASLYFELSDVASDDDLVRDLSSLEVVIEVTR